jgi:hypothetical protein
MLPEQPNSFGSADRHSTKRKDAPISTSESRQSELRIDTAERNSPRVRSAATIGFTAVEKISFHQGSVRIRQQQIQN